MGGKPGRFSGKTPRTFKPAHTHFTHFKVQSTRGEAKRSLPATCRPQQPTRLILPTFLRMQIAQRDGEPQKRAFVGSPANYWRKNATEPR